MSIVSRLKEKISQYIDVNLKLLKLNIIEVTSNVLSYFVFLLIGLFIFFCILLFLGFGLTELFAMVGFTRMAGFFLTIVVYLLLLGLLILLRAPITRFFAGGVITMLTAGDNDEDSDSEKNESIYDTENNS